MDFITKLNPVDLAAALAVVMPILVRLKQVKIVTSQNVQVWIIGAAAAIILVPAYINGSLIAANADTLLAQTISVVGLNVLFYEYVVKNLIKLFAWAKIQIAQLKK